MVFDGPDEYVITKFYCSGKHCINLVPVALKAVDVWWVVDDVVGPQMYL